MERRDGSKGIKKGDGNPRKISLDSLRGKGKGGKGGRDDRGGKKGGKPMKGGQGGGRRRFRDRKGRKPQDKDALDKEMDDWRTKNGNKELGKFI